MIKSKFLPGLCGARALKVLLVSAVAVLSACSSQVEYLSAMDETTVVAADEGIVVARIINATGYPAPLNQLTIAPEGLNTSDAEKYQRLLAQEARLNGTTVFASPVGAGNYTLASLGAWHSNGSFYYQHFVPGGTELGTFSVQPGQVTDLGMLIYYPRSDGDKYYKEIIRVPAEPGEVLEKYFSFVDKDVLPVRSWDDDGNDDDRNTFFASAAQNPTTFETPYLAPDGSIYFLGKLGVIVKRTATGEWEMDVVDTNLDLTTVAQSETGDLVVAGSEGRVFIKPADGEWRDLSIDPRYDIEHVMFSQDNTVDMVALEKLKLSVFRTDITAPAYGWEEVNTYASARGWAFPPPPPVDDDEPKKKKFPKRIVRSELHDVDGQPYIRVFTINRNASPLFTNAGSSDFTYDPVTWEATKPEKSPDIVRSLPAGASKIGIKEPGFWSWSGKPTYSRYDSASDSWEEITTSVYRCGQELTTKETCGVSEKSGAAVKAKKSGFTFRSVPWFYSETEGLAIVTFTDRDFWSGATDYSVKILQTSDGGLSWTDTGRSLPNEFCSTFVAEVPDRLLISCSNTGDFYESMDLGETWEHVRQHESF